MTSTFTTPTPGLFADLTVDELRALMVAIISPDTADRRGYSSNRICQALSWTSDAALYDRYYGVTSEIGRLHTEISEALLAAYEAEAAA